MAISGRSTAASQSKLRLAIIYQPKQATAGHHRCRSTRTRSPKPLSPKATMTKSAKPRRAKARAPALRKRRKPAGTKERQRKRATARHQRRLLVTSSVQAATAAHRHSTVCSSHRHLLERKRHSAAALTSVTAVGMCPLGVQSVHPNPFSTTAEPLLFSSSIVAPSAGKNLFPKLSSFRPRAPRHSSAAAISDATAGDEPPLVSLLLGKRQSSSSAHRRLPLLLLVNNCCPYQHTIDCCSSVKTPRHQGTSPHGEIISGNKPRSTGRERGDERGNNNASTRPP